MVKIEVKLFEESVDTLAKMMIGYLFGMPKESPHYDAKVMVVVEFLEEVLDPSFESVAVYLDVLGLLPETITRRLPARIEEFLKMYQRHIEEKMADRGGIPEKYKPKSILTLDTEIVVPQLILE